MSTLNGSPLVAHVAASTWPVLLVGTILFVAIAVRGHIAGPAVRRRGRTLRLVAVCMSAAAFVVALSPALEAAAASSFSLHMVQHLLLISVAAPLFVLGRPGALVRRAVPQQIHPTRAGRLLARTSAGATACAAATATGLAVLWLWHVPRLYDAAVASVPVHLVEHVTLLVAMAWFWTAVLHPRTPAHAALAALVVTTIGHALLGGLITFSGRPMYAAYPDLTDQQLAGLLMWVPGGAPHLLAAAAVVIAWIDRSDRRGELLGRAASPTIGPVGPPSASASASGHDVEVAHDLRELSSFGATRVTVGRTRRPRKTG